MTENTSVKINFQSPNISTVVYAVQNDKLSRHIVAQLLDGSAPWTPPAGAGAVIRYLKPDGTAGFYDVDESNDPAISVSGSVATLTLAEQCTTVPGDVYMQLNFYGTDGSKLTTFCWILRVQKSVLNDATIVSSDYFNVLTAKVSQAMQAAADAAESAAEAAASAASISIPLPITSGGTGANNIAAARANLQAAQMIVPADLAEYGLSVSGSAYNFTLAQLFQAVPAYSRVVIPWLQSQNTASYGTLAGELPTNTTDYGMLVLDKSSGLGEFRFIQYSSSEVWHGSYSTTNSRGFNGWWSDQRVLLWTNPTPSTLAPGTQNFSMTGYSQIEIECTRSGNTSETYFVRSGIGTSSSAVTVDLTTIRLETENSNLNSITLMSRTADVYSTGIVFSSGQMIYNGALYKDWNNRAVPYRVWGIR